MIDILSRQDIVSQKYLSRVEMLTLCREADIWTRNLQRRKQKYKKSSRSVRRRANRIESSESSSDSDVIQGRSLSVRAVAIEAGKTGGQSLSFDKVNPGLILDALAFFVIEKMVENGIIPNTVNVAKALLAPSTGYPKPLQSLSDREQYYMF